MHSAMAYTVPECIKGDSRINGKVGNSTPAPPKAPVPIVAKICMGDYVGDPYPYAKFHNDPPLSPKMCENSHQVTRLVFLGGSSDSLPPRPLHRFLRSIRQMTSFRARMCLLGVSKTKIYISTPFSPQMEIFGQFLTGFRNFRLKRP